MPAVPSSSPAEPVGDLLFRHRPALGEALAELWRARELVRTLAERDFRVRYKQALLGVAWAVVTPVVFTLVLTVVFTRVARVDHGDVPYPLFAFVGLLPWTFFATSVNTGGLSLVTNVPLLNKVYCPREVFPLASVTVALVDMLLGSAVLVGLMRWYDVGPASSWAYAPLLLVVQLAFTAGVVLAVSSVLVYLRDVRYALPVALQLGMFATPVAWPLTSLSESAQHLYVFLNPMGAVVDGYRRTLLLDAPPDWSLLGLASISAGAVLLLGYRLFKRLEAGIADVA